MGDIIKHLQRDWVVLRMKMGCVLKNLVTLILVYTKLKVQLK